MVAARWLGVALVGAALVGGALGTDESTGIVGVYLESMSTKSATGDLLEFTPYVPTGATYTVNRTTVSAYQAAFGFKVCFYRGTVGSNSAGLLDQRSMELTFDDGTGTFNSEAVVSVAMNNAGQGHEAYGTTDLQTNWFDYSGFSSPTAGSTAFTGFGTVNGADNKVDGHSATYKRAHDEGTDIQKLHVRIAGNGVYAPCIRMYWPHARTDTAWYTPGGAITGTDTLRVTITSPGEFYSNVARFEIKREPNAHPDVQFMPYDDALAMFSTNADKVKPLGRAWYGNDAARVKTLRVVERVCPTGVYSSTGDYGASTERVSYSASADIVYGVRLEANGNYPYFRELTAGATTAQADYANVFKYKAATLAVTSGLDADTYLDEGASGGFENGAVGIPRHSGSTLTNIGAELAWKGPQCGSAHRYVVSLKFFEPWSTTTFDPDDQADWADCYDSGKTVGCAVNGDAPPVGVTVRLAKLAAYNAGSPDPDLSGDGVVAATSEDSMVINFRETATEPDIDAIASELDLKMVLGFSGYAGGVFNAYMYVRNQYYAETTNGNGASIIHIVAVSDEPFKPVSNGRYIFGTTAIDGGVTGAKFCSNLGDDYETYLEDRDGTANVFTSDDHGDLADNPDKFVTYYTGVGIRALTASTSPFTDPLYPIGTVSNGRLNNDFNFETQSSFNDGNAEDTIWLRLYGSLENLVGCTKQASADAAVTVENDRTTGVVRYTVPITGTMLLLHNGDFIQLSTTTTYVTMTRDATFSVSTMMGSSYIKMAAAVTGVVVEVESSTGALEDVCDGTKDYGALTEIGYGVTGVPTCAAASDFARVMVTLDVEFERAGWDYGLLPMGEIATLNAAPTPATTYTYEPASDSCYGVMNTYYSRDLSVTYLGSTTTHTKFRITYGTAYAPIDTSRFKTISEVFGSSYTTATAEACDGVGNNPAPGAFGVRVPVYRTDSTDSNGDYWGWARRYSLTSSFEYVATSEIGVQLSVDINNENYDAAGRSTVAASTLTQKITREVATETNYFRPAGTTNAANIDGYVKRGDRLVMHIYDADSATRDLNELFIERVVVAILDEDADDYADFVAGNALGSGTYAHVCDAGVLQAGESYSGSGTDVNPISTTYTFIDGYVPVDTPVDLSGIDTTGAKLGTALCRYDLSVSENSNGDTAGTMDYFRDAPRCGLTGEPTVFSASRSGAGASAADETGMYDAFAIPSIGLPINRPIKVCVEMRAFDTSAVATQSGRRLLASTNLRTPRGRNLLQADATTPAYSPYNYLFATPSGASSVWMLVDTDINEADDGAAKVMESDDALVAVLASVGGAVVVVALCVFAVLAYRRRRRGDDYNEEKQNLAAPPPAVPGWTGHG